MEGNAIAPKESVFRSMLWAMGVAIVGAALLIAITFGTAPLRAYCVAAVGLFGVGFASRRLGDWDMSRPKSYQRIAVDSLMATAVVLFAELMLPLLDETARYLPARFYLLWSPAIFLVWCLIGLSDRRRLEKSARKRAELEKWSWEYEAKRRVEEMKSVP
jgi:hypothetical protein